MDNANNDCAHDNIRMAYHTECCMDCPVKFREFDSSSDAYGYAKGRDVVLMNRPGYPHIYRVMIAA